MLTLRNIQAPPACASRPPRGRYLYCGALCALLVAGQLAAEITQVRRGFRPFVHAPTRVAYSWDMFAIRIDRCAMSWDPALRIEGTSVKTWADRSYPIEFDTVYNRAESYLRAGVRGCVYEQKPGTKLHLTCAMADGRIHESTFGCR